MTVRTKEEYVEAAQRYLTPNYGERNLVLVRGEGCRVWDIEGREYLDFLAGISVNNLGHCPPAVVEALTQQIQQFMHCSNFYLIPTQVELAAQLCELCFADRCFFCNSGAEANEAAIKLARLWAKKQYSAERYEIVTMRNSFHGRTLATITATGQEKVQKGFEPLVPGFTYARFNDLESVREALNERTCAIMLEPVQGEGGVVPATKEFLEGVRELCNEHGLLLIFDEVQCGMGRCGRLFAHQLYGVDPDIMTLAKALGNGYPIGAMLAREEVGALLGPGTHGSTFGGNPPACAAGLAVLREMARNNWPAHAEKVGAAFQAMLRERLGKLPNVKEIRGIGLMIGVELTHSGADVVKECIKRGLIINCTMGNVLRLLPPLTVTESECEKAAAIISEVLQLDTIIKASSPN
jgi:predicted acetylornithine/succinylornithine family transaminase